MNANEVLANRANELLGEHARHVRAGASERPRQHGAVHQRRDPDRNIRLALAVASSTALLARVRGAARRAGRERAASSTTS